MKKISIITICYNEPNLNDTCKSIVEQTYQDFEWIVIDGGSNKSIQEVFQKYKYRIDKFISEPDTGIYNAMNKGIKLAENEYLSFMNAGDCYYSNNVLQNFLDTSLDKDIIYPNIQILGKTNSIVKYPKKLDTNFWILKSLPHPSTFIKKELFDKYGLYNEQNRIVSDWEKWIEFIHINNCSYKHVNFIGANFNTNGISCNVQNNKCHQNERDKIIQKYFTQEEIKKAYKNIVQYSLIEKIFSVKNHTDKKHKIITFLGIHLKIKRKKQGEKFD